MPQPCTGKSTHNSGGLTLAFNNRAERLEVGARGMAANLAPELESLLREAGAPISLFEDSGAHGPDHGFVLEQWRRSPLSEDLRLTPVHGLPGTLKGLAPRLSCLLATVPECASEQSWNTIADLARPVLGDMPHIVCVEQLGALSALQERLPHAELTLLSSPEAIDMVLGDADKIDMLLLSREHGALFERLALGLAGTRDLSVRLSASECQLQVGHQASATAKVDPSSLVLSAAWMMLATGRVEVAEKLQNAVLKTLEEGVHTNAIEPLNPYSTWVVPERMVEAIASRLGQSPRRLKPVEFRRDSGSSVQRPHLKRVV